MKNKSSETKFIPDFVFSSSEPKIVIIKATTMNSVFHTPMYSHDSNTYSNNNFHIYILFLFWIKMPTMCVNVVFFARTEILIFHF